MCLSPAPRTPSLTHLLSVWRSTLILSAWSCWLMWGTHKHLWTFHLSEQYNLTRTQPSHSWLSGTRSSCRSATICDPSTTAAPSSRQASCKNKSREKKGSYKAFLWVLWECYMAMCLYARESEGSHWEKELADTDGSGRRACVKMH